MFLSLAGAHAQQLEFLNRNVDGKVARDMQGNWIFAERSGGHLRIRKLSADLTQTAFDITAGGSGLESITGLQVDGAGNAYVIGMTASKDFPVTANALWPLVTGLGTSFFLKVDAGGKIATSTLLTLTGGTIVAADFVPAQNGDWIIAAQATGAETIRASGVEIPGSGMLLLLRISQDGTVLKGGRRVEAGLQPTVVALRSDPTGNFFVAGSTTADNFPATPGAFGQKRLSGQCSGGIGPVIGSFPCSTGFLMKFDVGDFHTIAATYLGGTLSATLAGLAVDRLGYPYVTGTLARFTSDPADYPVTQGAFQTTIMGSGTLFVTLPFVTKLTPDLTALAYSTFLGGSVSEFSSTIAVDEAGRALISGATSSSDFPTTGAFKSRCGPSYLNSPAVGFVTRLTADGSGVESSAILDANASIQFLEGGDPVATAASGLVRVHMAAATGPVAGCTVNGANFRREGFLGPDQIVTVLGGPFPEQTRLKFDGVAAPLLYSGASQINGVVPRSVAGRVTTLMEIDVDGVRSNARQFDVREANPTVFLEIAPDGSVDNRGNLLATVALSNGTLNTEQNPAHIGEVVTIFATGLDVTRPIAMRLNFSDVPVLRVGELPGTFGSVVGLDVKIPGPAGGLYVIRIQNGSAVTAENAGFVWTQ